MEQFDCLVLGFGPGGLEAARTLLQGGKKVAIVNRGPWGGVCLNCGCIPTKLLLGAIEPGRLLENFYRRKLADGNVRVDYARLQAYIKKYIESTSASLGPIYEKMGATLIQGTGRIMGKGAVLVEETGEQLSADTIIVATGSKPGFFPGMEPDHKIILDSTDLMFIEEVPASLCVVGAGAIGLELADFFSAMGSKLTMVEAATHLAPGVDGDIAEVLTQNLKKRGYKIHTGVPATRIFAADGKARLELSDGTVLETEKALIATGRKPNTAGPECEKAGIHLDRHGFIEVDEHLRAASGIYAIGDVIGKVLLAHAATRQGNYVANQIMGKDEGPYVSGPVPSCIYCHPAIMRVGLTETEARQRGDVKVSKSQFSVNPIARAHAAPEGFTKAVWLDGRLAGMAAIGVNSTQLATAAELLVANDYDSEKLHQLMVVHPSLDESLADAIYNKPE